MSDATINTSTAPGPGEGLTCPLCDYDLRGTAEPRCPECGYTFDWTELRAVREHPYLFEHHHRRNVRAFFETLGEGWYPPTFWTTLQPTQPTNDRRLTIYQFLVSIPAWLVPIGIAAIAVARTIQTNGSLFINLEQAFINYRTTRNLAIVALQMVFWPWLTYATLIILQQTLQRARIRPTHLVRCAVYCSDATLAGGLFLFAVVLVGACTDGIDSLARLPFVLDLVRLVMLSTPLLVAWRLTYACGNYLRIPHAAGVAIVTQFMLMLVVLIVGLQCGLLNLYWLFL